MPPQATDTNKGTREEPQDLSINFGKILASPPPGEEIVISGVSGKYPESKNVHEFAENLLTKADMVTDDTRRWEPLHPEVPQRTGKIPNIEKFDAGFFGISHRQATSTDPMCRVFLEKAIEAIMDAGINPAELENTNTGVFVGICFVESENYWFFKNTTSNMNPIIGCERSIVPHRISYFLKFKGPSYVVDTACSSSLFGLEHAYKALRNGECDRALVGGCNMCIHPYVSLQFARLGVLSKDGSCKAFDIDGNGYARSETISCVMLEKAKTAKRNYYTICHAKTNCDGFKSSGITFPSREMQSKLLHEFYHECNVKPSELSFLEAHGTGTKVGDPEELMAIEDVFLGDRKTPLLIGSTKSNIGHTEPSSGLCSLTKVIIATETELIPPNLHFKTPRPECKSLVEGRMEVVTEKMPFRDDRGLVGINSFGFGGSNCHVLLKRNQKLKVNNGRPKDDLTRIICVSGRTRAAITSLLEDAAEKMDAEYIRLIQDVFSKDIVGHSYRGFSLANKCGEVTRSIKQCGAKQLPFYICFSELDSIDVIGKQLLEIPIFEKTIQKVHEIIAPNKLSVFNLITKSRNGSPINHYIASVAIQIGLINVFKMLEIEPNGFFGLYSIPMVGELICAFYDGNLTLRELVELSFLIISNKKKELLEQLTKIALEKKPSSPRHLSNSQSISAEYAKKCFEGRHPTNILFTNKIPKGALVLEIGDNKATKDILKKCNIVNVGSSFEHFLNGIGRVFEAGHNPQVHRLYPQITFPVSRGTPMIAPKILWDHNRDYWVTVYRAGDQMDIEARCANVTTQNLTFKYLEGHVVDGRNLFPATGYLLLAWEALCSIYGFMLADTQVIFENCRFKRACTVPKTAERIELVALVQRSTGVFEIEESGVPVMSGRIYLAKSSEEDLFTMQPDTSLAKRGPELMKKDVYKELKLRGYHYSGDFKGIESCNPNCDVGYVKWKNNWVTFMDNMLQMRILQEDSRLLYVPTNIRRIYVNAKLHNEIGAAYGDKPIPVQVSRSSGIVKSGGIEMRGIIASSIARRKYLGTPVLEKYEFIPNQANISTRQSVRINMQIALENAANIKVKAVEVIDEATEKDSEPLAPIILEVLEDLPLIKPDITIFSKEQLEIDNIKVENRKLYSESECTLVVGSKVLQSIPALQMAFGCLIPNGYILSRESLDVNLSSINDADINILSIHTTQNEKLVLFRKYVKTPEYKVIQVSQADDKFTWLDTLKTTLKKDPNVILYSQNEILSGILGLVNCIRREPGGNTIRCFFIVGDAPPFNVSDPFYAKQINKNMAINVYKNSGWGTYRHLTMEEIEEVEAEHFFVNSTVRGDLSTLKWTEGNLKSDMVMESEKSLVYVYYSAVNFRDIMTATGKINVDVVTRDRRQQECVQGFEFSGKTKDGRRVMGLLTGGGAATMVEAEDSILWDVPDYWSLEDAATVPVVYGTCLYSLIKIGKIKRGDIVLIHSGSGGIGIAAITIALHFGCIVYTTIGTTEKREFLKKRFPQLSDRNIANSRDTSFETHIMAETKGRGVDIVLNSLAEEKLLASVRCLAKGGRFLEIGKYDLGNDNRLRLSLLEKGASFHGIMFDALFTAKSSDKKEVSDILKKAIECGAAKPLPRTVFKVNEVEKAFRHMMTGKHIGKSLIQVRKEEPGIKTLPKPMRFKGVPRYYCNPEEVVIICGGLGGFGLELADWLVLRGCQKLVLTSRNGIKTGYQGYRVSVWNSYGCEVHISTVDITTKEGAEKLITDSQKLGNIKAIFNLAVVLKDSLLENQTSEAFATSFGPKANATLHLDEWTRKLCPDLKDFVVFSSVSCGRGNAGQSNYGMANSVMERICEKRRKDGYPALAIQWGAVGEVGLVAEMQENYVEMEIGGTLQQRISSCLQVLDVFLRQNNATIVSSMVVAEKRAGSGGAENVVTAVANILGIKDLKAISFQATLAEVGMDSMSAVEIKQTLEREFEVFLTPQDIKTMTFARLQEIQTDIDDQKEKGVKKERALVGMEMVVRLFGNEALDNMPIVLMKSKATEGYNADKLTIITLPGIEGAACILDPLAANLDAKLFGLQYCYDDQRPTIEEMAEVLLPHIEQNLSRKEPFNLVAYSFGAVVGVEVVRILESKGYTGTLICVDGSPSYMKGLTKIVYTDNEDQFQTNLLIQMMALEISHDVVAKNIGDLLKCGSFHDRMVLAKKIAEENGAKLPRSVEQMKTFAINLYTRLKAIEAYNPKFKLQTPVKLFKPKYVSIKLESDDYELSNICVHPVEVQEFDGNHATVLQNPELADAIIKSFGGVIAEEEKTEDSKKGEEGSSV